MKYHLKSAAALRYDEEKKGAPKMTAHGNGLIADRIIAKAKENKLPILKDPTLVELLAKLNVNETIPEELYEAVAEVFAFVYRLDHQVDNNKK